MCVRTYVWIRIIIVQWYISTVRLDRAHETSRRTIITVNADKRRVDRCFVIQYVFYYADLYILTIDRVMDFKVSSMFLNIESWLLNK